MKEWMTHDVVFYFRYRVNFEQLNYDSDEFLSDDEYI